MREVDVSRDLGGREKGGWAKGQEGKACFRCTTLGSRCRSVWEKVSFRVKEMDVGGVHSLTSLHFGSREADIVYRKLIYVT